MWRYTSLGSLRLLKFYCTVLSSYRRISTCQIVSFSCGSCTTHFSIFFEVWLISPSWSYYCLWRDTKPCKLYLVYCYFVCRVWCARPNYTIQTKHIHIKAQMSTLQIVRNIYVSTGRMCLVAIQHRVRICQHSIGVFFCAFIAVKFNSSLLILDLSVHFD
jgi:hypothetical protein